jgi:hypothetical protein
MGQLDQFAKQMFAEETEVVTHGAVTWQIPPEIGLSEVRLDGLLQVRDPSRLVTLAAPWSEAGEHDEIVVEVSCYRVGPLPFSFLWMAANELPLVDELIPFLVARSGRALDEFGRWIARRRPPEWMLRMVQIVPMTTSVRDDLMGAYPEVRAEVVATEIEKGLAHLFERRLNRPLADEEHQVLRERLARLGANRLGDVVLDLSAEALATWLANPTAT